VLATGSSGFGALNGESEIRRFPVVSTRLTCEFRLSSDPRGRACRALPSTDGYAFSLVSSPYSFESGLQGRESTRPAVQPPV